MGPVRGRRVLVLTRSKTTLPTTDPDAVGRYSGRGFPPYRFVPGQAPHPTRDPRGHSYGAAEVREDFDPDRWRECAAYLHGVDLFNAGFWWEAHEALEGLWARLPEPSAPRSFLQGLIQLSAALLKRHMGHGDAARRLVAKARETLSSVRGDYAGVAVDALVDAVDGAAADHTVEAPVIVLAGVDPPA